jgi:hypothetical protein
LPYLLQISVDLSKLGEVQVSCSPREESLSLPEVFPERCIPSTGSGKWITSWAVGEHRLQSPGKWEILFVAPGLISTMDGTTSSDSRAL